MDDGSTDSSVEAALDFCRNHPTRAKYCRLNGVGAAAARNFAIRQITSQYVAFLDADDLWMPHKLETQLSIMRARGSVFCYSAFKKLDGQSNVGKTVFNVPDSVTYDRLLRGNPIRCFTVVYDHHRLGPVIMPNIKMRNDLLAWLHVLQRLGSISEPDHSLLPGALAPVGRGQLVLGINEVLGFYRQHPASLTGNKLRAAKYQWIAYRRHLQLPITSTIFNFAIYALNGLRSYSQR